MAKEQELKKVYLKVSVNCCEGCKRKVKKALKSIDGVLKTEIDPSQPKVTVTGNVDACTLINKLGKAGKPAEIWPGENHKSQKEEKKAENSEKEVEMATVAKEKPKDSDGGKKNGCEQGKCSNSISNTSDTGNANMSSNKAEKKGSKDGEEGSSSNASVSEVKKNVNPAPQVIYTINPSMIHDTGSVRYYQMVEPSPVLPPYYTLASYSAPVPYYVRDYYYCELPVAHPPPQYMGPRLTDYFSEENTGGCHVM